MAEPSSKLTAVGWPCPSGRPCGCRVTDKQMTRTVSSSWRYRRCCSLSVFPIASKESEVDDGHAVVSLRLFLLQQRQSTTIQGICTASWSETGTGRYTRVDRPPLDDRTWARTSRIRIPAITRSAVQSHACSWQACGRNRQPAHE